MTFDTALTQMRRLTNAILFFWVNIYQFPNIALLSRKCSINATTKYKYIQSFYLYLDGDLSQIEVNCLAHIIVVMGHRCLFSLEYPNPQFLRTRSITMYIVHQHVLKNRRNRCTTLEKKNNFFILHPFIIRP